MRIRAFLPVSSMGLVLLTALMWLGAAGPAARGGKPEASKLVVEFANGDVVLNGTKLSLPAERAQLLQVLGKPDREAALANTILTWDELGIHAYQTPKTTKINALEVSLAREKFVFSPKKSFSGTVKVSGLAVTPATTIEAVGQAVKPVALKKGFNSWNAQYGATFLFIYTAKQATGGKVRIVSLALAQQTVD